MSRLMDRMLRYLEGGCSDGAAYDEIADALDLSRRQAASNCCREMERARLIIRCRVGGRIRNFLVANGVVAPPSDSDDTVCPWHWEGHVQDAVLQFLNGSRYTITKCCNTATRERGKDIEAEKADASKMLYTKTGKLRNPRTTAFQI